MLGKVAVMDQFYIWTKGGVSKPTSKKCIISAHGGQSVINSKFSVPSNTKFIFYSPHNYTLTDPSLEKILQGACTPQDPVTGGKCQDYNLSKYQGRHGKDAESYAQIAKLGDATVELETLLAAEGDGATPQQTAALRAKIQRIQTQEHMDIITIRNRHMRSDPSFSQLVSWLKDEGFGYEEYHCSFCRGPSLPWKKEAGSHSPLT